MTLKERECKNVSWEELIQRLLDIFASDKVNIEEVEDLLRSYR